MARYPKLLREKIQVLRSTGLTYSEINQKLQTTIPKGSLSYICKDVVLKDKHRERIKQENLRKLAHAQKKAVAANTEQISAQKN